MAISITLFNNFDVFGKVDNIMFNQKPTLSIDYLQNRMKDFLKDLVICEFVDYSEGELLLIECVRSNINPYEMLGIVLNEFSLELSLKLDEHIVSNKINIAKFFEIYSQYVSSIKYIRKL
jgi:hypothetical protein